MKPMQQQESRGSEPNYIVVAKNRATLFSVTDLLLANGASFCFTRRLPQLAALLEEVIRPIVIIDLTPWGLTLAEALAEQMQRTVHGACICVVSRTQAREIRACTWGSSLYLVAKECLAEAMPGVLHRCAEVQRMQCRTDELLHLEKQSLYNILSKEAEGMKLEDKNIFKRDLTRRSFLKGTAAAAAAAGVAMSGGMKLLSPAEAAPGERDGSREQVFVGMCRSACVQGCVFNITVRDGKVVKVLPAQLPDPAYTRCCLKGLSHTQFIYDENRLKYPMKRVGARGSGEWERITWDEAIETITSKWKSLREQYGNATIAFHHSSGNFGALATYPPPRFGAAMGFSQVSNTADQAGMQAGMKALGFGKMYTGSEQKSLAYAKAVVVWGSNATETDVHGWRFVAEAMEKGAKLYTINSNFTTIAAKSDLFLPVKPTTDAILAMAMMNIVIAEDLIDVPFMTKSTVAPFLVKQSDGKFLRLSDLGRLEEGQADAIVVRGASGTVGTAAEVTNPMIEGSFTVDGIKVDTAYTLLKARIAEWTPEVAAKMCELPLSDIYSMARAFGTESPVAVIVGYGPDRYTNGHYAYSAMVALLMLTGNLGKKGTYFAAQYIAGMHYLNTGGYQSADGAPGMFSFTSADLYNVMMEETYHNTPIKVTGLYIAQGNILGNAPDRQKMLAAFDKMEFIVTHNVSMSDTAMYADIVLPACHWFEYTDAILSGPPLPYAVIQERAIAPLYESKSDLEIIGLLAKAMGIGEYFSRTDEETLELFLDHDGARALGISWPALKEKKFVRMFSEELYVHGDGGVFPTATGRAQFYFETPTPSRNYGQTFDVEKERLPSWEPPSEAWEDNALFVKYPLRFTQRHAKWRTHTQFRRIGWLRELDPEPSVIINPIDAAARNIKNNDVVRVYNDRGYVVVRALINGGMRPGMVDVPHGWDRDQYIDGHASDLTSSKTNLFIKNDCFYDVLVEVAKEG